MKSKILIDFSPVKKGGALQLASNFFKNLSTQNTDNVDYYILVPQNFTLSYFQEAKFVKKVFIAPTNPVMRLFFEYFTLHRIIKNYQINKILTCIGSGLPHPKNVISVIGIAYPSICFPESEYFNQISTLKKVKKYIFDWLRIKRIRRANGIFVETDLMKERLSKIAKISPSKITIIPPTCSDYLDVDEKNLSKENKILLLSSDYYHKNLWRFYEIAKILKGQNYKIKFTLTISKKQWLNSLSEKTIDENLIQNYFEFLGPINPKNISSLYQKSKLLMLISDLESFSSNHPEAWKAKIPQIVSDRVFMRSVCKDSAIYVNPHNPTEVAESIIELLNNKELQQMLINNGEKLLAELPSQQERTDKILTFLRNTD